MSRGTKRERIKTPLQQLRSNLKGEREVKDYRSLRREQNYSKSRTGKLAKFGANVYQAGQQPLASGVASVLYARHAPPIPARGHTQSRPGYARTGRRGRPVGSFDPRYARYGGVYGFRKAEAHRRAIEKLEALRRAAINPQQQAVLDQIEARERARRENIENRTFPDTRGEVRLRSIHQEIDDAANVIP